MQLKILQTLQQAILSLNDSFKRRNPPLSNFKYDKDESKENNLSLNPSNGKLSALEFEILKKAKKKTKHTILCLINFCEPRLSTSELRIFKKEKQAVLSAGNSFKWQLLSASELETIEERETIDISFEYLIFPSGNYRGSQERVHQFLHRENMYLDIE